MYPEDLRYTEEHEWIRNEAGECTVGITAYASEQLGDITYVEPPNVGAILVKGAEADNVLLLTSISRPTKASMETPEGFDAEQRVWYVGATRARKRLIVVRDHRSLKVGLPV